MKIVSWNVNGIRAVHKKDFLDSFREISADIFCIQELRAEEDQIPDELKNIPGYQSFFNPSKIKKGHSGTAIYSKIKPEKVEYEIGYKEFDQEGRVIKLTFPDFSLFNFYVPQGGRGKENLEYKLNFYDFLINFDFNNKNAILIGDFNIAHKEIDLARPKENKNNIMFTPEEREKISGLLEGGFLDSFRIYNSENGNYTWWPYFGINARERNIGWRIDYCFISKNLKEKLISSNILSDILGSDHCPIEINLSG